MRTRTNLTVATDGACSLTSNLTFTGKEHENYRYMSEDSPEEQKKIFQEAIIQASTPVIKSHTLNVSPIHPEANCNIDFTVAKFASKSGKRIFVPCKPLFEPPTLPETKATRHTDIRIYYGGFSADTLIYHIPSGYTVESTPKSNIHLQNDFGTFDYSCTASGTDVIIVRQMLLKRTKQPASAYPAFVEFLKEIAKTDNQKIVLVEKAP